MEIKRFLNVLLVFTVFCVCVYSQSYTRTTENNEVLFIQKLSWHPIENIRYYSVDVQQKTENGFIDVYSTKTEDNFVEVSLSAGSYRYRVTVFNLLDKVGSRSGWREFEILKAQQPTVTSVSPTLFAADETIFVTVLGESIMPGAEYFLVDENGDKYAGTVVSGGQKNSGARVRFESIQEEGSFTVVVTNPGGLFAKSGKISVFVPVFEEIAAELPPAPEKKPEPVQKAESVVALPEPVPEPLPPAPVVAEIMPAESEEPAVPETEAAASGILPVPPSYLTNRDNVSDGLIYRVDRKTRGVVVKGYEGDSKNVVIPSEISGYPVLFIGEKAFKGSAVESVALPDGIKSIGSYAFKDCESLSKINIPSSVNYIGSESFTNSPLTEAVAADDLGFVWYESHNAFYNTSPSKEFQRNIYASSYKSGFGKNDCLEEILREEREKEAAWIAFAAQEHVSGDYVYNFDPKTLGACILVYNGAESDLVIPAELDGHRVVAVSEHVFEGKPIKSVEFPDDFETIGSCAFKNCKHLTNVDLPQSLDFIGHEAFYGCPLTNATASPSLTRLRSVGGNAFAKSKPPLDFCEQMMLCGYRTGFGTYYENALKQRLSDEIAFEKRENARRAKLAAEKHVSGEYEYHLNEDKKTGVVTAVVTAYLGGSNEISIPNTIDSYPVSAIGKNAFKEMPLRMVFIPEGVNKIESGAFKNCYDLNEVHFSSTVSYIGSYAFYKCPLKKSTAVGQWRRLSYVGEGAFAYTAPPKSVLSSVAYRGYLFSATKGRTDY